MSLQTLLVDDDRTFSAFASATLAREGFAVEAAHSLFEARRALEKLAFDLVVLDRRLPDGDGLAFLPELRTALPRAVVVVVTAHADIDSAVAAVRQGASDYIVKPVELADLVAKARRAVADLQLRDRLQHVEGELSDRRALTPPSSPAMKAVLEMLAQVARRPRAPVLLLGETGVGKEVLAWFVHQQSTHGRDAPFVHINCAALPETTIESELFGHERGAFTDARQSRRGLVEVAHGGTLFLDEVADLSASAQAKLLTFLDAGEFRRLGGHATQTSSARVVAATNKDLPGLVRQGLFREDLWFRLSVFRADIPPLRARREDIVPLAESLLQRLRAELGRRDVGFSAAARERLLAYDFPGNVRELRNIIERALVLENASTLELSSLSLATSSRPSVPGPDGAGPDSFVVDGDVITMEELERRYVRYALERFSGRRGETARALGISHPTLLKRLGEGG
jgi:two-component system response regulator AtoC